MIDENDLEFLAKLLEARQKLVKEILVRELEGKKVVVCPHCSQKFVVDLDAIPLIDVIDLIYVRCPHCEKVVKIRLVEGGDDETSE